MADVIRFTRARVFPKVWPPTISGGLLVVHRHPAERLANIAGCQQRIRIALRAFGIHVDQAHRGGAERIVNSFSRLCE